MMSDPVEPRGWTAGRWWAAIALVFAVQAALLVCLLDRAPAQPRKPAVAPAFRFSDSRMQEWVAVEDPTLFALPHRQGFSGEAWLNVPSFEFRPEDWSEPERWLPLDVPNLGSRFASFAETNTAVPFPTIAVTEPETPAAEDFSMAPPPTPSRVRIEGDLARRRLLAPLQLPWWTNSDLLTNSVVQLVVDARGNGLSAVLLASGSGLTQADADQKALELARTARFEAVKAQNPAAGLSLGTLIFEWQTVLAPSTNTPPVTP